MKKYRLIVFVWLLASLACNFTKYENTGRPVLSLSSLYAAARYKPCIPNYLCGKLRTIVQMVAFDRLTCSSKWKAG
jgi:hypothetical protein